MPMQKPRRGRWAPGHLGLCLGLLLGLIWPEVSVAGPVAERVKASGVLKVCIWPAYFGITYRDPATQQLSGLDIMLSAGFAQDLGARLQLVDSSFVTLIDDLLAERCDVAMFGVGMLPQRMDKLRFTQPYLKSDIYGITLRDSTRVKAWDDIDKGGTRVAVQAGTFMEPVMREVLKQGQMVLIKPPLSREKELEAGHVDVFMTDYPYSRKVMSQSDAFRLIRPGQPFFELPYAYAVKPGDADWLKRVDDFVARIKRDGRLAAAAREHGLSDIVVNH
jgi:cyclohexadienyl dehydratase